MHVPERRLIVKSGPQQVDQRPTITGMSNYKGNAPTEMHAPERRLIIKNVPQQVDQRPTINGMPQQKCMPQKEDSL